MLRMRSKLLVVAGTRPEAIKLAPVILALRERGLPYSVCTTGQHPTLAAEAFDSFGIRADHRLRILRRGQPLAALQARGEAAVAKLLAVERPDAVVVHGDTTSALAASIAAARAGIAVAHVEAGLRSHDLLSPYPEEANRVAIARIAALHFAPTPLARANLRAEGVAEGAIAVTGNTIVDALHLILTRDRSDPVPPAVGRRRILVTLHRRENRPAFGGLIAALVDIAARGDTEIVLTRHPSADAALYRPLEAYGNVRLPPPLGYVDFVRLMSTAYLVLTDSGGVQEEAAVLGIPALIARDATERPEVVDAGCARLVGTDRRTVAAAIAELLDNRKLHAAMSTPTPALGDGLAGERIADRLARFLA